MHYGSEEKSEAESKTQHGEAEAGPQDRGGEEVDCEEDWNGSSQEESDRQKEVNWQRRGARPRAFFISHLKQ